MATPETALAMARSVFPPEFLNRLELIVFNALSQDTMARVCVGLVQEVSSQLEANSGVRLSVSPEAALFISNKAYVPEYGARPIRRMIQSDLATEVAKLVISGQAKKGDEVVVTVRGRELSYAIQKGSASSDIDMK